MKSFLIHLTLILGLTVLCGLTPMFDVNKAPVQNADSSYQRQTSKLLQGTWILDTDSLAYLNITKSKLTFHLAGTPTKSANKYNLEITDNYKPLLDKEGREIFLILKNKSDTMCYEIITLTNEKMKLVFYPSGNIYSYTKPKGKPKYDKSTKINRYNDL